MDRTDIDAAARRIRGRVRRTPIQLLDEGDPWLPAGGCLKLELLQHTGTFKPRGAFNRILASRERGELDPAVGIVVASGGNAGLANAYAAAEVGVPATVFVPRIASPTKLRRLREYGATVVLAGTEYAEAHEAAMERVSQTGAVYCHAYDQPEIAADTVLLAIGGGGLMSGVATAVAGRARVVAVEPATAPTLTAALAAGAPVDVAVSGVAADSLGARRLGSIAWDAAQREAVDGVLVDDDAIGEARRQVWERYRLVLEAGAAAPVAALLSGRFQPQPGEQVAVVLCGANTDPSDLSAPSPREG